jgi:uncharacterized membrane protein YkoI
MLTVTLIYLRNYLYRNIMVMTYKALTTTTKIVSAVVILSAIITITGESVFTPILQNAIAQTTTNSNATNMMTDTMTEQRGVMIMRMHNENVTSSINLTNILSNAIESQVKVSLSNATTTAENSVGNNSHAVAARLADENGYLVYTIWVLDPNIKFNKVIVDPGNGQVLLSKQISMEEHKGIMMMGPAMFGPIIHPNPLIALGDPIVVPDPWIALSPIIHPDPLIALSPIIHPDPLIALSPIVPPDPLIGDPIIQPFWPIILFAANNTTVIVPTE